MSFSFESGGAAAPGAPPRYYRHPLGLPAGSVRALLTFMVLGTVWTLLLMPPEKGVKVPLYLTYLMFLVIGSYFGARSAAPKGKGVQESSPLYLPRGSIRFLIILGFLGVCAYGCFAAYRPKADGTPGNPLDFFYNLKFDTESIAKEPFLPFIIFGTYFLGTVISTMAGWILAGEEGMPAWYQDIQAWISVLAVLGLGAGIIYELVIKPTLTSAPFDLPSAFPWQTILSGIVAFYFGARS
jgi:hypothetical protein